MVFDHMTTYIAANGDGRYSFLLKTVMDEALDEMAESEPDSFERWFSEFGDIVRWIGTGDINDLPEALRRIAVPESTAAAIKELADTVGTHS